MTPRGLRRSQRGKEFGPFSSRCLVKLSRPAIVHATLAAKSSAQNVLWLLTDLGIVPAGWNNIHRVGVPARPLFIATKCASEQIEKDKEEIIIGHFNWSEIR